MIIIIIILFSFTDYRLVIICSNEEEEKSHIISKLHSCRRPFPLMLDSEQCQRYLKAHFIDQTESDASSQSQPATASKVDHETLVIKNLNQFIFFYKEHYCRIFVPFVVARVCGWLHRRDQAWENPFSSSVWHSNFR